MPGTPGITPTLPVEECVKGADMSLMELTVRIDKLAANIPGIPGPKDKLKADTVMMGKSLGFAGAIGLSQHGIASALTSMADNPAYGVLREDINAITKGSRSAAGELAARYGVKAPFAGAREFGALDEIMNPRLSKFAGYIPSNNMVVIGSKMRQPGMLAHEFGHHLNHNAKSRLMRAFYSSGMYAPRIGAGIAAASTLLPHIKNRETRDKWLNAASIAGGGVMIPRLADEGMAHYKGLQLLKAKGLPRNMRTVLPMAGGMATYLGSTAITAGLPLFLKKWAADRDEKIRPFVIR